MRQIAFYGKGGIGKSTMAANLSAAIALTGLHVLQIGCDPKQDSTRLLLQGRRITTALEYLRATSPNSRRLDEIVHTGFANVACVEAGGPEPGIGCAGRGILSTFDLLDHLGISRCDFDTTVYDVLGDVVCGGFAVPLRSEYADIIYIVTSGELMSLYAGNNILRGVCNYEGAGPRMGGIVFNQRGLQDEELWVLRFAEAVRLPVIANFPRSRSFTEAELLGKTIVEAFPQSDLAEKFHHMAGYVTSDPPRFPARPLSMDELEAIVFASANRPSSINASRPPAPFEPEKHKAKQSPPAPVLRVPPRRYCSKSVQNHGVLHGCAFNGAAHIAMQIRDAVTVVHGPRSCAHLSSLGLASASRRVVDRYGIRGRTSTPSLHCSDLDERVVIFGGNSNLETTIRQVSARNPSALLVVTTCASGIIGDDVRRSIAAARDAASGAPILLVPSDGDITGDYMQGVIDAIITVAGELIDPTTVPRDDMVNIVAEKNLANNTEENFRIVRRLLGFLGLRINCRLIRKCSIAQLRGFPRGRLNLLAHDDFLGRTIRDFLVNRHNVSFAPDPFPFGFQSTANWLSGIASIIGKPGAAEQLIVREKHEYEKAIAQLRPSLEGKRLFVTALNHHIDWLLETAMDLGMEIVKVGILESAWDDIFHTRHANRFPLEWPYAREKREEDMLALKPDLTLTSYPWKSIPEGFRFDTVPLCPDVGFGTGLEAARRWDRLMKLPAREGWKNDL